MAMAIAIVNIVLALRVCGWPVWVPCSSWGIFSPGFYLKFKITQTDHTTAHTTTHRPHPHYIDHTQKARSPGGTPLDMPLDSRGPPGPNPPSPGHKKRRGSRRFAVREWWSTKVKVAVIKGQGRKRLSAIRTAFNAEPRRRWSPQTNKSRPLLPCTSDRRIRPTPTSCCSVVLLGIG